MISSKESCDISIVAASGAWRIHSDERTLPKLHLPAIFGCGAGISTKARRDWHKAAILFKLTGYNEITTCYATISWTLNPPPPQTEKLTPECVP